MIVLSRNRTGLIIWAKKQTRLAYVMTVAIVLSAIAPYVGAETRPSLMSLGSPGMAISFGVPSGGDSNFHYLQTGALVRSPSGAVPTIETGTVLFVKRASVFGNQRFGGASEFVAIAHDDGFISLYSGTSFSADPALTSGKVKKFDSVGRVTLERRDNGSLYLLRLYDSSSGIWINPALFADSIEDKAPPKIEQMTLEGSGGLYHAMNSDGAARKTAQKSGQKIPQGEYALSVSVRDTPNPKGSVSGVFRLKVLFNGKLVLDKKFDAARAEPTGLSFIGLVAPSSTCLDRGGGIVLGRQFIPRGQNTLELTAFDFVGNSARYLWSFMTE